MKIRYKKKHLNYYLFFGIFWLIFSIAGILLREKRMWTDYGFLIISLLYLGIYLYERRNHYLTIEDNTLSINSLFFGKQIRFDEVKRFKKFAGDYIFIGDDKKLTVNTQLIDPDSLKDLDAELEKQGLL